MILETNEKNALSQTSTPPFGQRLPRDKKFDVSTPLAHSTYLGRQLSESRIASREPPPKFGGIIRNA